MKKREIIKESREFDRMIATCKMKKNAYALVFYEPSSTKEALYGISVPKKCGKAHLRNFLKRRTREILSFYKKNYPNSFNCIIIIRKTCITSSYEEMKEHLIKLLMEIEKEKENEKDTH